MSDRLESGSLLAGYRIEQVLGEGGMGLVYLAQHMVLGRRAALKVLAPELARDGDFRERFVQESQMVAALDHPSIIPIYDAGEADGRCFIAMRYVQGLDLGALIERDGPLDPQRALALLEPLAGALDAAHAGELVHRDVKPGNVLVEDSDGRVYLTDFGIAKQTRSPGRTQAGLFVGSPDYAAPEQIEGKAVGPATDLYALGCVLYECLTGVRPFDRPTDIAVLHAHLLDPPPPVSAGRTDLSPALDQVVARAMAKDETERFRSCRELIEAAQTALAAGAVPVAPPPPARPTDTLPRLDSQAPLPVPATTLVGREAELDAVCKALRDPNVRLLTLTGPGGTGKTRLALAAGAALAEELGGACFVDLAQLGDPALVPGALTSALGLGDAAAVPLAQAVRSRLGTDSLLLVLDNFEHLLPAAPLVAEVLEAAPGLKALVTSQAALNLRGEHKHPVPPLTVPAAGAEGESAAIALFVDRARAVKPDFELTEESAPAVAEICRRLEGLPLAIELAAARVSLLSPHALADRLEQGLSVLGAGAQDLPERQRTLEGAIDWSYRLLDEHEQGLLRRLGVFTGGCTLAVAEAVCEAGALGEVLDTLASLLDKSLLSQQEGADGEPRFRLFETIREYALARLEERGELDELRRRHAERYVGLVEAAEPELVRGSQAVWLQRLDEENGNLWAALDWALDAGEPEIALRLAGALVRFWSTRGVMAEGRRRLQRALELGAGVSEPVRAKALFAAGYAALGQGDYQEATARFEESLALARSLDDARGKAAALAQLGWLAFTRGEHEQAATLATEGLDLAEQTGERLVASGAMNVLAEAAAERGEPDESTRLLEQSLGLRRQLGDRRLVANSLLNLARAELGRGQVEQSEQLAEEGLTLAREVRDTWSISLALVNLGRVRLETGDAAGARSRFGKALAVARERGDKRVTAESLQGLAAALADQGHAEEAASLLGAGDALLEAIGVASSPLEKAIRKRVEARLRDQLGAEPFAAAVATGRRLDTDEAGELGLRLSAE